MYVEIIIIIPCAVQYSLFSSLLSWLSTLKWVQQYIQ